MNAFIVLLAIQFGMFLGIMVAVLLNWYEERPSKWDDPIEPIDEYLARVYKWDE